LLKIVSFDPLNSKNPVLSKYQQLLISDMGLSLKIFIFAPDDNMKILLLGEYSNVHWTLAKGLRHLGHHVTVASGGDGFKQYNRDIDLYRKSYHLKDSVKYIFGLIKNFSSFKGYDIVQIINPFFLDLRADKNLQAFRYLKKHNKKVFMGAFGDDCYWLKACLDKNIFRYSEFNIPGRTEYMESAQKLVKTWTDKDKIRVNREIAEKSDGIIACLYEYYISYKNDFADKLIYIPEPIDTSGIQFRQRGINPDKIVFFIGIQKSRSEIKGTDILFKVLQKINMDYPDICTIMKAESVPHHEYLKMMDNSDVILDQLYSYSPAMNALTAMAKGMVAVSGGEPEIYTLLGESNNKPVINVIPSEEDIYNKLQQLILNKKNIPEISLKSRSFVETHHNYLQVASQYISFWKKQ